MMKGSSKMKNDEKNKNRLTILKEFEKLKKRKDLYGYPNKPKDNPYVTLAEGFEFYSWLLKILKNEKTIRKSFVLSFLYKNEFDKSFDKLRKFVLHPFKNKKTQDSISQKWHYYIAWYLMKEYWGIIGHDDGIKDFENTTASTFRSIELNKWKEQKGKGKNYEFNICGL